MPRYHSFILAFAIILTVTGLYGSTSAQNKIIILVRHGEKESAAPMTSAAGGNQDPDLSSAGKERAARLIKLVGKHKPGAFYSTGFKRTRETVEPFAAKRHATVQIYDDRGQKQLAETILNSKIRTTVVVGHSNTIPALANLLTGKDMFKNLPDSEYGVVWVIRMKDGKFKRLEVLPY